MSTQPEALRLADALLKAPGHGQVTGYCDDAAAELRRLHALNQELLEALKLAYPHINPKAVDAKRARTNPLAECYVNTIARAAIAKAEGQT